MRDNRYSKTRTDNRKSGVFQLFGLLDLNIPKVKYNDLTETSARLPVCFFRKKKQVRDLLLSSLKSKPNPLTSNPYPLITRIVSLITILAFHISFVIPLTLFSLLSSAFNPLNAQSVPTLGSTKQFANDELKPYVDAAKAGATDSGSFLNTVTNGEQVLEAAWETGVNAEIESIVGGVNNADPVNNVNVYKDAVRAQLELQKQQAKSQWLADANAYIQAELQSNHPTNHTFR
ncbi:hypothetical protein FH581_015020 [Leptospira weilii]|nr:hypothetical protein [Leptospira weilii]UPY77239.1 hypothetical protein FH581_015020 [Leptospira weilii]